MAEKRMTDSADECRIPVAMAARFCYDVLEAVGVPAEDATIVADSLTQADASGLTSHGMMRLLPVYVRRLQAGTTRPRPQIRVLQRRVAAALVDGDAGLGQVVGSYAIRLAVEMARSVGSGVVGVCRSSHFGTGAFFVKQAVEAGMIGLALTNAPANMPPYGGYRRFFGTNPLAVGIPCGEERPVILDMSTSVVARGKIVMMHKAGQNIPAGWALDEEGRPTQDAAAALRGVVLPFAGYKGSGLAFIIDALCGVLTGAAFGPHIVDLYDEGECIQNLGHFFAAVDVAAFMPTAQFRACMDQMVREVRSQPRQPGVERIYVPGEIEQEKLAESLRTGISLPAVGLVELDRLAGQLGVRPLSGRM